MNKDEINETDLTFPDYNDSILNLSCSILKSYGIAPKHPTMSEVDEILSQNFKHVVVILLDGLGMNILENNLSHMDFLRRHLLRDYSSVFPPTTTASTTTMLSGLSPIEHGWLGWDVYFEKENKTVTCFHNTLQNSSEIAADYNIPYKYLSYENIIDQINKKGSAKANAIFPFGSEGKPEFNSWLNAIRKTCKTEDRTFTYAYWENPDSMLHQEGTNSLNIMKEIQKLNAKLSSFCEELKDTVIFITSDHGHTDIQNEFLEDYPEIIEMLERPTSIEPRAISFYVKPEYKEAFPEVFNKHFADSYKLFTKQEVLDKNLFGPGFPNDNLTGIGDYIGIAYTGKTLLWDRHCKQFRSHHAGITKNEMRIPLIWYENKQKKGRLFIYYAVLAIAIILIIVTLYK